MNQNAQSCYEFAAKDKDRLAGAREALERTRDEMEAKLAAIAKNVKKKKPSAKKGRELWFERFRWFVSSDCNLVLAGRDSQSNDRLVKKHLRERDRYAHAEMSGAPSVVVKRREEQEGVPEATLREACEFAVIFSKAWGHGISAASAYWVLPEQVSKTPNPGEFLAKGAFVIRGRRNYVADIAMVAAVGEVEVEGERKAMCGPLPAVKARSKRYIVLKPGEMAKNETAKLAAAELGFEIDDMLSVLPPGGFAIVERVGLG